MTEAQLHLIVELIQENDRVNEKDDTKMSESDRRRFEELRLKKSRGEELNDKDKDFLKKHENFFQKVISHARANPKGISAMKGLKGLADEWKKSSEQIGSLRDLYI